MRNKTYIVFTFTLFISLLTQSQEVYNYYKNETPPYSEVISLYQKLDKNYDNAHLYEIGYTDVGEPLYLFLINETLKNITESKKVKLFINNGIHPGEPCGVDASLRFSKNILEDSIQLDSEIAIAIIPLYNVGGALNRGRFSRANQDGPKEHGFRGNARNLDLNRDFIKMDSENAKTFAKAFHTVRPHIIVDTHTTNGADYQYNMTLLPTVSEQLSNPQEHFFREEVVPSVFERMEKAGEKSIPYVNMKGKTPEEGIVSYYDSPRYTTGYAALFHCWGFTSEAHMLKPYPKRVDATHTFLKIILEYVTDHSFHIKKFKEEAIKNSLLTDHNVYLENDMGKYEMIDFDGFEHTYKKSEITGQKRLFYDRQKPKTFSIRYFNRLKSKEAANTPDFYIIPQAWKELIPLLKLNDCKISIISSDTTITAQAFYVERNESLSKPYEGHFYHKELTITRSTTQEYHFKKGDFIITPTSYTAKFLTHVMHPTSKDSYLRWNYFDEIFQQKEWFSPYVFEDLAVEILKKDNELKERFEKKKIEDTSFAEDAFQQLYYIYKNSKYFENTYNRYPVFRVQ